MPHITHLCLSLNPILDIADSPTAPGCWMECNPLNVAFSLGSIKPSECAKLGGTGHWGRIPSLWYCVLVPNWGSSRESCQGKNWCRIDQKRRCFHHLKGTSSMQQNCGPWHINCKIELIEEVSYILLLIKYPRQNKWKFCVFLYISKLNGPSNGCFILYFLYKMWFS